MRIIICGGRNFEPTRVFDWMEANFHREYPNASLVIHGACGQNLDEDGKTIGRMKGADKGAHDWCIFRGFPVLPTPANWTKYGRFSAGPIRNLEMLEKNWPVGAVLAFPGEGGTKDMMARALKFGLTPRFIFW